MHSIIPYFEPFSFSLGPVPIHGFGILVALGFVFGSNLAQKKAEAFGGDAELINRLVGWLILGTFVGGHLGDVLWYRPGDLANDPALFSAMFAALASGRLPTAQEIPLILRVWEGLSSFGGFSVCVPLAVWFFWREKKPFWPHGDALAIGLTLGWFFGRMGCFSAHDHPGSISDSLLAVPFRWPEDCARGTPYEQCPVVYRHDLGLYEAIWSFSMWVLFTQLGKKARFPGFYCAMLAICYGPFRFLLDFGRTPYKDTRYAGLTPAQFGALAVTALGIWLFATQRNKPVMAIAGGAKA